MRCVENSFDYTAIVDQLMTVSLSSNNNQTGAVNPVYGYIISVTLSLILLRL